MVIGDPAVLDDRPGPAHIAAALILLALQFLLMLGLLFALSGTALDTVNCSSGRCDVRLVYGGVLATLIGGPVLLLATAAIAGWRLLTRRRAVSAAATGCVLQMFLALVSLMILGLA